MKYLFSILLSWIVCLNANAKSLELKLIGQYLIPTGTMFEHQAFGGISGIERSKNGHYYAISDERGSKNGSPRFYQLAIDYDENGFKNIQIQQQIKLKQANGALLSTSNPTVDPESIRLAPNGHLYWSSEGNFDKNPEKRANPFIHEIKANGDFVRAFEHPKQFNYIDNKTSGGRANNLFEALTVTDDGTLFVGTEGALIQDGNISTRKSSSHIRITAYNPKTGKAIKQYAYILPPIPNSSFISPYKINGLTEILSLGNQQFIMLERAFTLGAGNTIRLVESSIRNDTTDIIHIKSLKDAKFTPMTRKPLLELPPNYQGIKIDNIEGITWGKTLKNGNRSLILVSDNNFSKHQTTQFLAFEVIEK